MELKNVDISTARDVLAFMTYKHSPTMWLIERFMQSDVDVAEVIVDEGKYKQISSCASQLNACIKRMHVGAKAITKNGTVYLIKTTGKKS